MGGAKDKIMSLFKTNTTKDYIKSASVKNVHHGGKKPWKLKIQKESEDKITKNIRTLFKFMKENGTTKDRIIRDIETFFEQEEDFYKSVRVGNFWSNNILNMKVMEIEIKPYQSKNTLMKLSHI